MSPVGRSHLRESTRKPDRFATPLPPFASEKAGAGYRGPRNAYRLSMRHAGNGRYRLRFDLTTRDWTRIKAYRIERPRRCPRSVGTRSLTADPQPPPNTMEELPPERSASGMSEGQAPTIWLSPPTFDIRRAFQLPEGGVHEARMVRFLRCSNLGNRFQQVKTVTQPVRFAWCHGRPLAQAKAGSPANERARRLTS